MTSGRNRLPTNVLSLRGSWRAKTRKGEPQGRKGRPSSARWLDAEGRAYWRRLLPELEHLGVLSATDRESLLSLCASWSLFVRATTAQQKLGGDALGSEAARRLIITASDAYRNCLKGWDRFGLSPASRARLSVDPPKGADEFEQFVSDPKGA